MENKVCIILPIYNTDSEKLQRCLNHLISKRFEVIIIDDCSTSLDTTLCLEKYTKRENFHILRNEINLGAGEARRKGIKYLIDNNGFGAKYFGFIDSDDEIDEKKYLEFVDEVYNFKAKAGLARIKCYLSDNAIAGFNSRTYSDRKSIIDLTANPYILKMGPSILTCRLFSIDLADQFDINYLAKAYEDTEILYFIFALANQIYISNKVVYYYYLHQDSLFFTNMRVTSSNGLKQILLSSDSRNTHFKNAGMYDNFRKPLTSLELTYYLQRLNRVLKSDEIANKAEIAAYIIKLISIHIPDFEELFKSYQLLGLTDDKDYLKYTELNDLLNNFRALIKYKEYKDEISEHIDGIPNDETQILNLYDKSLVLKPKKRR